jgi:hypothetical protein
MGGGWEEGGGSPSFMTEYDGKLYMRAQTVDTGTELFVYDPAISTDEVTLAWDSVLGSYESCAGMNGAPPCQTFGNNGSTHYLTLHNDKFYFQAIQSDRELWVYDPATGQGEIFWDMFPGESIPGAPNHGDPKYITSAGGNLFFQGANASYALELFVVSWPDAC